VIPATILPSADYRACVIRHIVPPSPR